MAAVTGARLPDALKKSLLVVVAALAAFFVYRNVLPYFTWNEASYGYYWMFRAPLILHVTGGLIAALAGVWQLWSGFNTQAMSVHPWTGRLYVVGVLLGSLAALPAGHVERHDLARLGGAAAHLRDGARAQARVTV
jgi:hypothetical protein